jgi:hypothetical protein
MTFSIPSPKPDEPFTVETLEPEVWYHIYCTETHPTKADTFNEGWGQTRFAPIKDAAGTQVHTYYAASTMRCAMMESILHDVSLAMPQPFRMSRLHHFHLATIKLPAPLPAVSFHTPFLEALQLSRTQLIESLPAYYDRTSQWSEAAYAQVTNAAAIMYGSRRDDAGKCIMLFKDRLPTPAKPFHVIGDQPLASTTLSRQFIELLTQLRIPQSP